MAAQSSIRPSHFFSVSGLQPVTETNKPKKSQSVRSEAAGVNCPLCSETKQAEQTSTPTPPQRRERYRRRARPRETGDGCCEGGDEAVAETEKEKKQTESTQLVVSTHWWVISQKESQSTPSAHKLHLQRVSMWQILLLLVLMIYHLFHEISNVHALHPAFFPLDEARQEDVWLWTLEILSISLFAFASAVFKLWEHSLADSLPLHFYCTLTCCSR